MSKKNATAEPPEAEHTEDELKGGNGGLVARHSTVVDGVEGVRWRRG